MNNIKVIMIKMMIQMMIHMMKIQVTEPLIFRLKVIQQMASLKGLAWVNLEADQISLVIPVMCRALLVNLFFFSFLAACGSQGESEGHNIRHSAGEKDKKKKKMDKVCAT